MSKDLKNKKNDYLLELALEEQLDQDFDMIKYKSGENVESPYELLPEQEQRIQRIFKMADRVERKPRRNRKYRQMAAGFVLLFCISAFSVMQVEAFRLPVMRFFIEMKEKSTIFGINVENEGDLTSNYKRYEPQYAPAGFSVVSVQEGEGTFHIQYLNEQKLQIYIYYFFETPQSVAIDTEDGDTVKIKIDGNPAYMVQEGGQVRILMYKDNKQFYLDGTMPVEEAIKVMESIQ